MSDKVKFVVAYDSGEWRNCILDVNGEIDYQEPAEFALYDKIADGFRWGMLVKAKGQRKFHARGPVTLSIVALLDYVKEYLSQGSEVICLTPDIEIEFYSE